MIEQQALSTWHDAVSAIRALYEHLLGSRMPIDTFWYVVKELSCVPFTWPMCRVTLDVEFVYRHVTRLYRAELLERALRHGESEAWHWLKRVKPQILLHFAAKMAELISDLIAPAQEFACQRDLRLRGMFASSFWYRQIINNMAKLKYGEMNAREARAHKAQHDESMPCGLVKLLFNPDQTANFILLCYVHWLQCFFPVAWVQPILTGHSTMPIKEKSKFHTYDRIEKPNWKGMSQLVFHVSLDRQHKCIPDIRADYPACERDFIRGVVNDNGARLFVDGHAVKWHFNVPVFHSDITVDTDVVPDLAFPPQWADNLYLNVRIDDNQWNIHTATHHTYLLSLNTDPDTLALVSISKNKTIKDHFLAEQRREHSERLRYIWRNLHTNFGFGSGNIFTPISNSEFARIQAAVRDMPEDFGFTLSEPYRYLTHLTGDKIKFGGEIFRAPSTASLVAASWMSNVSPVSSPKTHEIVQCSFASSGTTSSTTHSSSHLLVAWVLWSTPLP